MNKLDAKDRKILSCLDMNARMPLNELAKKTGLSRQVALYRIDKLKKQGIILGSLAIFDSVVVGKQWYRVLIRLGSNAPKEELTHYFSTHPFAMWVASIGGNWDFIINFIADDNFAFNALFEEILVK